MQIDREYSRQSELLTMNMNTLPGLLSVKRFNPMKPLFALLIATSLLGTANAATYTWIGPSGGAYSATNNWSGGVVPVAGDTIVSGTAGVATNLNGGTIDVGTVFNQGILAWTFQGNSGTTTFNVGSLVGGSATFQINNGSNAAGVQTHLNVANINITSGILYLGGSSTTNQSSLYALDVSGTTNLTGARINVNVNGPGQTYSLGTLNVTSGTVSLNLVSQDNKGHSTAHVDGLMGAGGQIQNSFFNNTSGNTSTLVITNTANFSTGTVLANGGTAGNITGPLSLAKAGSGTQTLTSTNTYTGSTGISEGVLQLGANGTTGSIVSDVITSGTGALAFNRSNAYTFSNTISGSGQVFQVGSGTTTLSAVNTYSGGTRINAGGLVVSSDANLGASEGTVSFDGGTLLMTASGTMSSDRNTTINAGGAKFYGVGNTLNTWGGDISGVGGLTKQGTNSAASILHLTGSNTYQGGTVIQAGVLRVDSDQNLGDAAGTVTFNNGSSTGRLETSQSITSNRDFILNGTTAGIATTGTGNVTVLNGNISGAGILEKRFVGTLHLTGSNTYASTSITGGVVRVNGDQNLGLGAVGFNNTSSASTLETTQSMTTSKGLALNNTTSTATVMTTGTGNTTTWNGQITGSGAGGLVKDGSGVLVLSASNTYSAGTAVAAGTLLLTNASAAGSGAVAISGGNGATLHVDVDAGAGSISNAVVFTSAVNGGAYVLERANGSAFSDYEASSSITGGLNTTASLLAGTASTDRTLSTSLSLTASVAATNAGVVLSDVFSLEGTETDIFVLQLQIANVDADQYLGWLNGTNTWVNAIDGNTNLGGSAVQGYAGSYAASGASATSNYLGSWGYDTTNDTVWAVLDHNSEFAVIPEPSTWVLLAMGLGSGVILGLKRRRVA